MDAVLTNYPLNTMQCSPATGHARLAAEQPIGIDQKSVPNEIEPLHLSNNLVDNEIDLRFTMAAEKTNLTMHNQMGQIVFHTEIEAALWESKAITIPSIKLASGFYFISLVNGPQKETIRFVRR